MVGKILVVDDEEAVRESIGIVLRPEYKVDFAIGGDEALRKLKEDAPDLVLLDLIMPGISGLEVLRRIRQEDHTLPVVILTGARTVSTAIEAMKAGAADYLTKPFDVEELLIAVRRAIEGVALERELHRLRAELASRFGLGGLIGKSAKMRKIFGRIAQVADTRSTVLITGESGTGKELVARALHFHSSRRDRPFVVVNCAALPEGLIESEVFGHERGAFTDAHARKLGQFEVANGGTLFLDEVAELTPGTQAKLLRVLQEREFLRVGGTKPIRTDVRLVTATNQNLEKRMRSGYFREDLFYRINVVPIQMPPLRDRAEDIPLLLTHFLAQHAPPGGGPVRRFAPEAVEVLLRYPWPGNVRELENLVEEVVALTPRDPIGARDLPPRLRGKPALPNLREDTLQGRISLEDAVRSFEDDLIREALERTRGNQTQASSLLGISRRMLKYKMDRLGIPTRPED